MAGQLLCIWEEKQSAYRNLDTHIPMAAFARLDTGPPPFAGDPSCAMGREVALDRFFSHFFPVRLYRLVRRRLGAKGADVLEECEAEVFDLRCVSCAVTERTYLAETAVAYADLAPQPLAADPGGPAERDVERDAAPVALETPPEGVLGTRLEGLGGGGEDAGGVEGGEEDDGAVEVGDGALAGGGDVRLEGGDEDIAHGGAPAAGGGECALGAGGRGEGEAEGDAVCARGGEAEAVGVGGGRREGGGGAEREGVRVVVEHVPGGGQLCGRQIGTPGRTHLQTPPRAPCRRPRGARRPPAPAPPPAPARPPPPPHTPAPPPRPPPPAHAPSCSPPAAPRPRPPPPPAGPATAAATAHRPAGSPAPPTTAACRTTGPAACPVARAAPPRQTATAPAASLSPRAHRPVCFRSMAATAARRPASRPPPGVRWCTSGQRTRAQSRGA